MASRPRAALIPKILPGEWEAELVGGGTIHLGGTRDMSPPAHAIEFSWVTSPVLTHGPDKRCVPGVVVFFAPVKPMQHDFPGQLIEGPIGVMLDLSVTREQFTDLLRWVEAGTLMRIQLTVEIGDNGKWPVSLWSSVRELSAKPRT